MLRVILICTATIQGCIELTIQFAVTYPDAPVFKQYITQLILPENITSQLDQINLTPLNFPDLI